MKRLAVWMMITVLFLSAGFPAYAITSTEKENNYAAAILQLETYLESAGNSSAELSGIMSAFEELGGYEQSKFLAYYVSVLMKIEADEFDYLLYFDLDTLEKNGTFKKYLQEDLQSSAIKPVEALQAYAEAREFEFNGRTAEAVAAYERCLDFYDATERSRKIQFSFADNVYNAAMEQMKKGELVAAYFTFLNVGIPKYKETDRYIAFILDELGYTPASPDDTLQQVTGLVSQTGISQATIFWNRAKHAAEYEVYHKKSSEQDWQFDETTSQTSATITGLDEDTSYDFMVVSAIRKFKAAGALISEQKTGRTTPAPTPKPTPTLSVAAKAVPEGYPEIKEGIDFGGAKIWIYDYWTSSSARKKNPNAEEQAQYDYRDWIMRTYNCEIEQIADGDWGSNATQLVNFFGAPDGSLRIYILPPDFVGGPMSQGALAAWNNDLINLTDKRWNGGATVDFMTLGGKTYGVSAGNSEPRQCLYFNKQILEAAGIDWNTIYDMQADGTWTWEAFENMLKQIQQDIDNDGVIDIMGMTGSEVDMYRVAVFANGGCFFDSDENGKLAIAAGSDNTLEALTWSKDIFNTYFYQQPADGSWDYYKDAWLQNFCGFYIYQAYGGFNDNSEMSSAPFDWGCVAFPIGPKGTTYTTVVSDNVTVIPNVYDADTVAKLSYIYQLWSAATPGYYDEYGWVGNKLNYTDDRAVLETYAMLREPEHCSSDKVLYLGSVNDVEGQDFLWKLAESTPAELLEAKTPVWQGLLDAFN